MQPDNKNVAPTAQKKESGSSEGMDDASWLLRARAAFQSSTTYFDNNLRKNLDDGIKMFNNQHPNDSKYNSVAYDKRSKLFRPKIRSIIRKNEAAAAAAFFSNMEVVDVSAVNPGNKDQRISAEVMKPLLEYRLDKSISWFQVVLGGLQDAQSTGVVCAHIYWDSVAKPQVAEAEEVEVKDESEDEEYPRQLNLPEGAEAVGPEEKEGPVPMTAALPGTVPQASTTSAPAPMQPPQAAAPEQPPQAQEQPPAPQVQIPEGPDFLVDRPAVDLIPVENLRISPSSDWTDPIGTSPFVIHLIPMYVMDVKEKMDVGDWHPLSESTILASGEIKTDSTRASRQVGRDDPHSPDTIDVNDYTIVWVQRHIHRREGMDWEFYTMGDQDMLTSPKPLKSSVFHGKRPYVMGCCILETHKIYPTSIGQLGKGLQDEANEVANQRIDNVKFVLNKKWFIKRGKDVDIMGLVRNVPGGIVSMDDPDKDVREINWPDVTQSAYEEQTRIDNDLSELLGNFSPAQVMADHGINGPARNMAMLSQSAGTLVEYLLRTYVETFVQPVLRQLVLLEQEYETDQVIIDIASAKSDVLQKFGVDKVTDQLLNQEITLKVNVGMGATDPGTKLQRFMTGVTSYANIVKMAPLGLNLEEVGKEVFGHLGYSDGKRFFTNENPQVAMLQEQLKVMQQQMEELHTKATDKMAGHQVKVEVAKAGNETKEKIAVMHEENENLRNSVIHMRALVEAKHEHEHELRMAGLQHRHEKSMPKKMGDSK